MIAPDCMIAIAVLALHANHTSQTTRCALPNSGRILCFMSAFKKDPQYVNLD